MTRRFLKTALEGVIAISLLNFGCTKIDTTSLGGDLLPVVDNVNTFETLIDVTSYQGIFNDTTTLSRLDDHVLGNIETDPDFGKTEAAVYVQLKPPFYPFYIPTRNDTLVGVDSVVLALSYKSAYGDTSVIQQITVKEVAANAGGLWDSLFKRKPLTYAPPVGNNVLFNNAPFQEVDIRKLTNVVRFANNKDSVRGQIRIRLSNEYAMKLFKQDSARITRTSLGFIGNAFYSDSIFRSNFKGLAIEPVPGSGNALMTIDLSDPKTRLEIHYRKKNAANVADTSYTSLTLQTTEFGVAFPSATANKVTRTYVGTFSAVPRIPKDIIYLQTTPGTFADLNFPGLDTFKNTNRIIHRAQIRITQIPDPSLISFTTFLPPAFLYLDLKDSTPGNNYKPVYFDLNPSLYYNPDNVPAGSYYPSTVDYGYFGGFLKKKTDPLSSMAVWYYDFNITRHIQKMVTENGPNYEMRIFGPYTFSYPQYSQVLIDYPNDLAHGRIKVGGTNGNYKMQMSVIWSKVRPR